MGQTADGKMYADPQQGKSLTYVRASADLPPPHVPGAVCPVCVEPGYLNSTTAASAISTR